MVKIQEATPPPLRSKGAEPCLTPPPHTAEHAAQAHAELTLAAWLAMVRSRGYRLVVVEDGAVALAPTTDARTCWPVWRDHVALTRWQHALRVAVGRTHPDWWAFASGTSDVAPTVVPMAVDGTDAFACAACGGPAETIDGRAVAHCADHHPSTGWPAVRS